MRVFLFGRRSATATADESPTLGSWRRGARGTVSPRPGARRSPLVTSLIHYLRGPCGPRPAAAGRDGHQRAALLFQPLREGRGADRVRGTEQHLLHTRLRGVDDGAAPRQTRVRPPLLESGRPAVPLAAGDGVAVGLDGGIRA